MALGAKHLGYWGAKRLGWKIEAKRLGGKRLGGKRLGGETSCDPSWKRLRMKATPDLHLTYSKNRGNLGLA